MLQPTQGAPIYVRRRKDFDDSRGVPASSGAIHHDGWTEFPTAWIRDRRLSIDARGLLACLASYRDHELPTIDVLVRANSDDREDVERYLAELERVGYLVRHSGGRFGVRDASLRVAA